MVVKPGRLHKDIQTLMSNELFSDVKFRFQVSSLFVSGSRPGDEPSANWWFVWAPNEVGVRRFGDGDVNHESVSHVLVIYLRNNPHFLPALRVCSTYVYRQSTSPCQRLPPTRHIMLLCCRPRPRCLPSLGLLRLSMVLVLVRWTGNWILVPDPRERGVKSPARLETVAWATSLPLGCLRTLVRPGIR